MWDYWYAFGSRTLDLSINPMSEADQVALFVKGLQPMLRTAVMMHPPTAEVFSDVINVRNMAERIEIYSRDENCLKH